MSHGYTPNFPGGYASEPHWGNPHESAPSLEELTPAKATPAEAEQPVPVGAVEARTVRLDNPYSTKLKNPWDDQEVSMVLPPDRHEEFLGQVSRLPQIDPTTTADGRVWLENIKSAYRHVPPNKVFEASADRPGSEWRQFVQTDNRKLAAAKPAIGDYSGQKLTGEKAMFAVRAAIGLGSVIQIPLWHSGFWVAIKAPSEAQLLELEHRVLTEKISLGRATNGAVFSNMSAYIAKFVMDLFEQQIHSSTLQSTANLIEKISILDLHHVAWGLATAIWPNGFQYARPVAFAGEDGVPEVRTVTENLEIGKLQFTDNSVFTEWQLSHMSQRAGTNMSDVMVARYKDEFSNNKSRVFKLTDELSVELNTPSVSQYLNSGYRWVNELVALSDRVFAVTDDDSDRNRYIADHARSTAMRQYTHWVKAIHVGTSVVEDADTICQILDDLSSETAVRKRFTESVTEYINDATISVIAVPSVTETEENVYPRWPRLVPIDAINTFFTLVGQKVESITRR